MKYFMEFENLAVAQKWLAFISRIYTLCDSLFVAFRILSLASHFESFYVQLFDK